MALVFIKKPVGTLKARLTGTTTTVSVPGVTTADTTPDNAATQVNKLFALGGKTIVADDNMEILEKKEAVNNE